MTDGRKPFEHGTQAGYSMHQARKEPIPPDDRCGCRAAHAAYKRAWRAKKREEKRD
jgi:hypothetical protein